MFKSVFYVIWILRTSSKFLEKNWCYFTSIKIVKRLFNKLVCLLVEKAFSRLAPHNKTEVWTFFLQNRNIRLIQLLSSFNRSKIKFFFNFQKNRPGARNINLDNTFGCKSNIWLFKFAIYTFLFKLKTIPGLENWRKCLILTPAWAGKFKEAMH